MIATCKICGISIDGDYDYVAGQIVSHYKGSHGINISSEDILGPAPKVKEIKVSHAETLETYSVPIVDVNAPAESRKEKAVKI